MIPFASYLCLPGYGVSRSLFEVYTVVYVCIYIIYIYTHEIRGRGSFHFSTGRWGVTGWRRLRYNELSLNKEHNTYIIILRLSYILSYISIFWEKNAFPTRFSLPKNHVQRKEKKKKLETAKYH